MRFHCFALTAAGLLASAVAFGQILPTTSLGGTVAKKKVHGPLQKRIAELERRLGAKQLEVDFFRRTFEHVRGVMQNPENAGEKPSIKESKLRSHSKEKD